MKSYIFQRKGVVAALCSITTFALTMASASPALAAPITVTYKGPAVTTAVPGKPFKLNFQVKNTSNDDYSGTKVIFHIPHELEYSAVAPANADIEDGTISWSNVPFESGQSFYPSFTLTLAKGTPLKTKVSIWVQVMGNDMEETSRNFSITAVKATPANTSPLNTNGVKMLFQEIYGRAPSASELSYWLSRRTDKPAEAALRGAIAFHKANNIKH